MAYLEADGKRWRVRWREGGSLRSSERLGKTEAQKLKRRLTLEQQAAKPLGVRRHRALPLEELVERWLKVGGGKPRYQEKTRATLKRLFDARGWSTVLDCRATEIRGQVKIGEWRLLRALLHYAGTINQPIDHAALLLSAPDRKRRPPKPLITPEQIRRAIAECAIWAPGNAGIALLVARYGHRAESLVGLPCSAIAGGKLRITVKSGDDVCHDLLPEDVDLLHPLACGRPANAPLFLSHLGGPWESGDRFAGWYWHQIGKHIHPEDKGYYALKRFSITSMLSGSLDVATIASITGHRTHSTILTYARTNEERQRRAMTVIGGMLPPAPAESHKSSTGL